MLAQLQQYDEEELKSLTNKIKLFNDPKEIKKVSDVVTAQRNSLNAINTYNNNILKLITASQLSKANAKTESILERSPVNDNTPIDSSELLSSLQSLTKLVDALSEKIKITDLSGSSQIVPTGTGSIVGNIGKAAAVFGAVAIGGALLSTVSRPDQTSDKLNKTTNNSIQKSEQRLEQTKVSEQSFASQFANFMASLFTGGLIGGSISGGLGGDVSQPSLSGSTNQNFQDIMNKAASFGDPHPELTAAQWAWESSEGKSGLAKRLNNVFGQTTNNPREGETIRGSDGITRIFKRYNSVDDAIKEHVEKWNKKYTNKDQTPHQALTEILNHRYTTQSEIPGYYKGIAAKLAENNIPFDQVYSNPVQKSQNFSNLSTSDAPKGTIWKGKDDSGLITFVSKTNDPRTGKVKYETWTNQDSTHYPISEEDAKVQIQTRGLKSNNTKAEKKPATKTSAPGISATITGRFGEKRPGHMHGGVDYRVPIGTPLYSTMSGTVIKAGQSQGFGQAIVVDVGNGIQLWYGHVSEINVRVGQQISAGQFIGKSGNAGRSSGPHLHFEVRKNGHAIDPSSYGNPLSGTSGQIIQQAAPRSQQLPKASTQSAINRARTKRHAPTVIVRNHQITKTVRPPIIASQSSQPKQIIRPTTEYFDYLV